MKCIVFETPSTASGPPPSRMEVGSDTNWHLLQNKGRELIALALCVCLVYLCQLRGLNSIKIGKISSLPASMSSVKIALPTGVKVLKLPDAKSNAAGPTLLTQDTVDVTASIKVDWALAVGLTMTKASTDNAINSRYTTK